MTQKQKKKPNKGAFSTKKKAVPVPPDPTDVLEDLDEALEDVDDLMEKQVDPDCGCW